MSRKTDGLLLALLLGVALMALSFIRTWGDLNSAMFGGDVIESALAEPLWDSRLGFRLAAFVGALLLVHLALGFVSWVLGLAARRVWPNQSGGIRTWTLLWFVALSGWVLLANARFFPASSLGGPYHRVVSADFLGIDLLVGFSVVLVIPIVCLTLLTLRRSVPVVLARRRVTSIAVLALAGLGTSVAFVRPMPDVVAFEQPHVVLIGVDSLRTDYLQRPDAPTPVMDEIVSAGTVFSDTLTPLARTFPAWVSLISGRNPHTTGAVINLAPRNSIDEGETLPRILKRSGYRTVYAIDEVRFSNLDSGYGFDRVIAPPMGAADFLIGFLYDFPLSNLLLNTPVGRVLFPFAYANRAAAITYDPDSFVRLIDAGLRIDGPTLLAVHFTLPHWPFTWAGSPEAGGDSDAELVRSRYVASVERVDQQIGDLLAVLDQHRVLENAIVVLFSDHGESLGEPVTLAGADPEAKQRFGHGTDVFADSEYQVLLAFRSLTPRVQIPEGLDLDIPASLEDVTPTLVDILGVDSGLSFDGRSLSAFFEPKETARGWENRIRFIETEYNPAGFDSMITPTASQIGDAARLYRLDAESDRLSIRTEKLDEIIRNREFAAIRGAVMLAALPARNGTRQRLFLRSGTDTPVRLLSAPDPASEPDAAALWEALQERFPPVRDRRVDWHGFGED